MNSFFQLFLLLFALFNLVVFFKSFYETKYKNNVFGLTRGLLFIGSFVWGDAIVFSLFWIVASLVSLALHDSYLFLLITSLFWLTRSIGEMIYWLNQQFSTINRNPPETLPWHSIFHNDSIWFIHQIIWQCVAVISIICSIVFARLWILSFTI